MANPLRKPLTVYLPEGDLEAYRQQAQAQGVTLEAHVGTVLHQALQVSPQTPEADAMPRLTLSTADDILSGRIKPQLLSFEDVMNRVDPTPDEDAEEMVRTLEAWRQEDRELEDELEDDLLPEYDFDYSSGRPNRFAKLAASNAADEELS